MTRYAMSASLKLTRSGRRSQCNIASASDTWSYRRSRNTKRAAALSVRAVDVVGDRQEARQTCVAVIKPKVEGRRELLSAGS